MKIATVGIVLYTLPTSQLPFNLLGTPSVSHRRPISSIHASSSSTTTKEAHRTTRTRPHSKSYLERQDAIIQFLQSTDLDSALLRLGGILKAPDLNVILRQFGEQSRWEELSKLFEWMQHNGKASASSYSSYIKFMGKSLSPVKVLEFYNNISDESIKNNVFICNSILSCLVRSGKFDSSMKLFQKMKQDSLSPDGFTYNTLFTGCIKMKNGYDTAIKLVQELKDNGLKMDAVMYGTILAVCASNNLCEEAERYFNEMKGEGISPNIYHYSSLLNAYASDGNHEKADSLVEEMKSSGLVPNKVMLTTLLKVYVRGGLFEKSRELLAELESLGYARDEMPYCLLMDGLSKAGRLDEARTVFNEVKEKRVNSDGFAHSIMITAFCRGGLINDAKELANEFEANQYGKYDLVMLNSMLCAYSRAGEMESVMQTMKKMDELAISPDKNTLSILIKYFCKEKLYLLAYKTMEDLRSKGYQPDEELCSTLVYHLGKIGAHMEAFTVYNTLRYSKRTMSKALHEKILHILLSGRLLKDAYLVVKDNGGLISQPAVKKFAVKFAKFGNINMMNDALKAVHSSGYKIDQGIFHFVISRYISQPEKKELLLQLLEWMTGQGYVVDSTTRNLILKNSQLFGRQLIAEILSKQHAISKANRSLD
ncbi:pentatricopeptide repeat-containing protein At1g10910, chloroplastic [Rutidosis leptorrhynchoides]|uniref:pentatricopeptide repeat-containing protein At1g10910, chloroplastic n=1 Tax=Rutidosis leptorrhynchoides TaxID=125765 RepID=UPI003A99C781